MKFSFERSYEILDRTPAVLRAILSGLHNDWTNGHEGPNTFSPFDVVGHLVHGEKTDWPDRVQVIMEHGTKQTFIPYDRFAMYEDSKGKDMDQLLNEFDTLRKEKMKWLRSLQLSASDLDKQGVHPKFGEVTLRQLLAAWVIHDLTHIAQITRVMAKQYKEEMGPWIEFFGIMKYPS